MKSFVISAYNENRFNFLLFLTLLLSLCLRVVFLDRAFGEYKMALYGYWLIFFIAVFGLKIFAARLASAFLGVRYLFKKNFGCSKINVKKK